MHINDKIYKILNNYESDTPGTKSNLARILNHGRLGGTGKVVILPVDQGFEHGPTRSFAVNPEAYDPHYHWRMAIDAGLNAFAAPLGLIEAGANSFAGCIPTILKMNSSNALSTVKDQTMTGSIADALRLGCSAVGFTVYPGSEYQFEMYEEFKSLAEEAKACGLAVVIWCYVRGGNVSKKGETAVDNISYAAHMGALLGAHIIKVKIPDNHLEGKENKEAFEKAKIDISTPEARIKEVVRSCFNGRRIVVFSGGSTKHENDVFSDAKAIKKGGGHGSIIGRNVFQRPKDKALSMLNNIINIYQQED